MNLVVSNVILHKLTKNSSSTLIQKLRTCNKCVIVSYFSPLATTDCNRPVDSHTITNMWKYYFGQLKVLKHLVHKVRKLNAVLQSDSLLFVPSHVRNIVTFEYLKCSKSVSGDKIPRVFKQRGRG